MAVKKKAQKIRRRSKKHTHIHIQEVHRTSTLYICAIRKSFAPNVPSIEHIKYIYIYYVEWAELWNKLNKFVVVFICVFFCAAVIVVILIFSSLVFLLHVRYS